MIGSVTEPKLSATGRVLRLLDLLQSRPVWSGSELARRLGVSTRSIRRDIELLRELGYPVNADHGAGGGYQLGAGRQLPPLLLNDDEAVAVAVCLRLAAGGTIDGLGEAAVRTLVKLDQVLPARLRAQVDAIHHATVTLDPTVPVVDGKVLLTLARGIRDHELVTFDYTSPRGLGERRVEPYQLVATMRKWYLLGYDVLRGDWRTFRLDRMTDVRMPGWRFRARPAPDAAAYVGREVSQTVYEHVARIRIEADCDTVRKAIPPGAGTVTADGAGCILETGGDDLDELARQLALVPWRMTILDPPELRDAMRRLAERLLGHSAPGFSPGEPDELGGWWSEQ